MSCLRPFDRWVRWATLLALTLATLAPGVSHALRNQRGDTMPWSQLCSASGGKRVVFESQAGETGSMPRTHAFEHCASCALHLDAHAPPKAPAGAWVLRSDLAHALPAPLPGATPTAHAWPAAQPRAPPLSA